MKAVVQRVKRAQVRIQNDVVGSCEQGLMVLVGVSAEDTEEDARILCGKLTKLRIFTDENDKMNLSVRDIGGSMLIVSQFTLLADTSHGNRPSFIGAGDPAHAKALYEKLINLIRADGVPVSSGHFGADMEVTIINDGPVTILLDTVPFRRGK